MKTLNHHNLGMHTYPDYPPPSKKKRNSLSVGTGRGGAMQWFFVLSFDHSACVASDLPQNSGCIPPTLPFSMVECWVCMCVWLPYLTPVTPAPPHGHKPTTNPPLNG